LDSSFVGEAQKFRKSLLLIWKLSYITVLGGRDVPMGPRSYLTAEKASFCQQTALNRGESWFRPRLSLKKIDANAKKWRGQHREWDFQNECYRNFG